jgi:hypothetical protein
VQAKFSVENIFEECLYQLNHGLLSTDELLVSVSLEYFSTYFTSVDAEVHVRATIGL